jgi:BCCT family betaine/carnitine transporter
MKTPSKRPTPTSPRSPAEGGGKKLRFPIDPFTTVIPLVVILLCCGAFLVAPDRSADILKTIRTFLEDRLGVYYLALGLGMLVLSLWISFSPIGNVVLGKPGEKPAHGFLAWGGMLFTAGLAADILFYSFCEWMLYAGESRVAELGSVQDWASTFPLFHWGPIPWSFYALLAACFGFMIHVRGVKKQKYSEACRPLLGRFTDKAPGKAIDVLAVFALVAGTATTFSLATPLLGAALSDLFGVPATKWISVGILLATCALYTNSVVHGMRGIRFLSQLCMCLFMGLLAFVFAFGGRPVYILETGFAALGNLVQNFIGLSTYTDPLRTTGFAQNWTIFYWAYWMVWCVAAPFFMGAISRGRTVRQVVLGSLFFGLAATLISFVVLGNYGLGLQMSGELDVLALYGANGDLYQTILDIIHTLPASPAVLVLLVVSMVAFYATSFDSITMVASAYSYREIAAGKEASLPMKLFWAILLILLPLALIFNESSMNNLQTVSMIAAFPIGIVIFLIVFSFVKDARRHIRETGGRI